MPANKHYSWEKSISLLGLGEDSLWTIQLDDCGRLDVSDLKLKIELAHKRKRPILMVVSVAGTTEMGEIDPIHRVCEALDEARNKFGTFIWHHVDAAYGGYYTSMLNDKQTEASLGLFCVSALRAISQTQSITIDPHKLGYVPYSCGAIITANADFYRTRQFHAPYLEVKNESRWAQTLEGSRSGAGATATWLSNKTLGLGADGYGRLLLKGLESKDLIIKEIQTRLPEILIQSPHDLNIICLSLSPHGCKLSDSNERTKKIFEKFNLSPHFSVSKTIIHITRYEKLIHRAAQERNLVIDTDHWFLLRIVLMNPFIVSKETTTRFVAEFVSELEKFVKSTTV